MAFRSLLTLASIAPAVMAVALPAIAVGGNPDSCSDADDHCYLVDVGYYSDQFCNDEIQHVCYASVTSDAGMCGDSNPSLYECASGNALSTSPFWVKVKDAHAGNEDVQVLFTEDQSCPPSGPGAVFATLSYNDNCVQINKAGAAPGISIYPNGGASIAARMAGNSSSTARSIQKRDAKCSGFRIDSESQSESPSVQISSIVDCTNGVNPDGTSAPCTITMGDQYTESVTTSYSATAGGGIEGLFEVSATFGMDYTESSTTTLQEGLTVTAGQKGYLSAYSGATLFKGAFTGCDSGDSEQPGQALVIKDNAFTYIVVNTGSS